MRKNIFKTDWVMALSSLFLCLIGLRTLYGICSVKGDFSNFYKQALFVGLGFLIMIFLSLFDWRSLKESPFLVLGFYLFCLLLLFGVLIFAGEVRGIKAWYRIGGFSLDPTELVKLALIILLAKYFSTRHVELYSMRHIVLSGVYVAAPMVLAFLQPNMGSILVFGAIWLGILFVSGIRLKHFLILCIAALLVFAVGWSTFLKDYQKNRILSFVFPQDEPLGIGWSQSQAKIAIGSGRIFGRGFSNGTQTQYGFLPEAHTDFIFSAVSEENGFVGVLVILILYCLLIWRMVKISLASESNFPRLVTFGVAISLTVNIFINIGMNLGLFPIVGIPLPFMSYGGSAIIANFIGLGIVQGIKVNN